MFKGNSPNPANLAKGTNGQRVYDILQSYNFKITDSTNFSSWAEASKTVTNMESMFEGCTSLEGIGLELWNTENVTNMSSMFNDALTFDRDISDWDTSKVTNMNSMFRNAISFDQIEIFKWTCTKVTNIINMFLNSGIVNNNNTDCVIWLEWNNSPNNCVLYAYLKQIKLCCESWTRGKIRLKFVQYHNTLDLK